MKKIVYVILAAAIAAGTYWIAAPKDMSGTPVIGVLQFTANNLRTLEGFKDGMAGYGYVEGETVRYMFHGPIPSLDQLAPAMGRLLAEKPDLIFASTTPAAKTAAELAAPRGVPVVFAPVNDPVSSGVVKNMRSPEGAATGVRLAPSDGRRLQSLSEIAPNIRRMFVPFNPDDPSAAASLAQIQAAAPNIGVTLVPRPFTRDMDVIADKVVPEGVDAIFLPREGLVMSRIRDFIAVSLDRRLPLSTPRFDQVEMGALTGYGFMGREIGRQAARLAHQILEGKPINELPVETARDYTFLNMETADKIGLRISDAFLRRVNFFVYAPR